MNYHISVQVMKVIVETFLNQFDYPITQNVSAVSAIMEISCPETMQNIWCFNQIMLFTEVVFLKL